MQLEALLLACAPLIASDTARALIEVESSVNPYAIGVVGGGLVRQPGSQSEAVATARELESAGWNYSAGLAQINKSNFARYGLTIETVFNPCANLQAMQSVLIECFDRAAKHGGGQAALRRALSCYYSGNLETGFRHGYVQKVVAAWTAAADRR